MIDRGLHIFSNPVLFPGKLDLCDETCKISFHVVNMNTSSSYFILFAMFSVPHIVSSPCDWSSAVLSHGSTVFEYDSRIVLCATAYVSQWALERDFNRQSLPKYVLRTAHWLTV
jgi:hypothetical protein